MVVSSFGLNGFDYDGTRWEVVSGDDTFNIGKSFFLDLLVLHDVILEWVFEKREGSLWPVESRNIELVDWLTASGGKGTEKTSMEGSLERHDG